MLSPQSVGEGIVLQVCDGESKRTLCMTGLGNALRLSAYAWVQYQLVSKTFHAVNCN